MTGRYYARPDGTGPDRHDPTTLVRLGHTAGDPAWVDALPGETAQETANRVAADWLGQIVCMHGEDDLDFTGYSVTATLYASDGPADDEDPLAIGEAGPWAPDLRAEATWRGADGRPRFRVGQPRTAPDRRGPRLGRRHGAHLARRGRPGRRRLRRRGRRRPGRLPQRRTGRGLATSREAPRGAGAGGERPGASNFRAAPRRSTSSERPGPQRRTRDPGGGKWGSGGERPGPSGPAVRTIDHPRMV